MMPMEMKKNFIRYGDKVRYRIIEVSVKKRNVFAGFLIVDGENEGGFSIDTVGVEATGSIGAGSGITAVSLTYLVWAVLSNLHVQQRLESEVATLAVDFAEAEVEALPYLNTVIEESLRP
jgi:cytochrome P450